MENEEIEKKEELTEDDKINLGLNPFFVGEVSTQNENQSSK